MPHKVVTPEKLDKIRQGVGLGYSLERIALSVGMKKPSTMYWLRQMGLKPTRPGLGLTKYSRGRNRTLDEG